MTVNPDRALAIAAAAAAAGTTQNHPNVEVEAAAVESPVVDENTDVNTTPMEEITTATESPIEQPKVAAPRPKIYEMQIKNIAKTVTVVDVQKLLKEREIPFKLVKKNNRWPYAIVHFEARFYLVKITYV
jgi:hypothetical protein